MLKQAPNLAKESPITPQAVNQSSKRLPKYIYMYVNVHPFVLTDSSIQNDCWSNMKILLNHKGKTESRLDALLSQNLPQMMPPEAAHAL